MFPCVAAERDVISCLKSLKRGRKFSTNWVVNERSLRGEKRIGSFDFYEAAFVGTATPDELQLGRLFLCRRRRPCWRQLPAIEPADSDKAETPAQRTSQCAAQRSTAVDRNGAESGANPRPLLDVQVLNGVQKGPPIGVEEAPPFRI